MGAMRKGAESNGRMPRLLAFAALLAAAAAQQRSVTLEQRAGLPGSVGQRFAGTHCPQGFIALPRLERAGGACFRSSECTPAPHACPDGKRLVAAEACCAGPAGGCGPVGLARLTCCDAPKHIASERLAAAAAAAETGLMHADGAGAAAGLLRRLLASLLPSSAAGASPTAATTVAVCIQGAAVTAAVAGNLSSDPVVAAALAALPPLGGVLAALPTVASWYAVRWDAAVLPVLANMLCAPPTLELPRDVADAGALALSQLLLPPLAAMLAPAADGGPGGGGSGGGSDAAGTPGLNASAVAASLTAANMQLSAAAARRIFQSDPVGFAKSMAPTWPSGGGGGSGRAAANASLGAGGAGAAGGNSSGSSGDAQGGGAASRLVGVLVGLVAAADAPGSSLLASGGLLSDWAVAAAVPLAVLQSLPGSDAMLAVAANMTVGATARGLLSAAASLGRTPLDGPPAWASTPPTPPDGASANRSALAAALLSATPQERRMFELFSASLGQLGPALVDVAAAIASYPAPLPAKAPPPPLAVPPPAPTPVPASTLPPLSPSSSAAAASCTAYATGESATSEVLRAATSPLGASPALRAALSVLPYAGDVLRALPPVARWWYARWDATMQPLMGIAVCPSAVDAISDSQADAALAFLRPLGLPLALRFFATRTGAAAAARVAAATGTDPRTLDAPSLSRASVRSLAAAVAAMEPQSRALLPALMASGGLLAAPDLVSALGYSVRAPAVAVALDALAVLQYAAELPLLASASLPAGADPLTSQLLSVSPSEAAALRALVSSCAAAQAAAVRAMSALGGEWITDLGTYGAAPLGALASPAASASPPPPPALPPSVPTAHGDKRGAAAITFVVILVVLVAGGVGACVFLRWRRKRAQQQAAGGDARKQARGNGAAAAAAAAPDESERTALIQSWPDSSSPAAAAPVAATAAAPATQAEASAGGSRRGFRPQLRGGQSASAASLAAGAPSAGAGSTIGSMGDTDSEAETAQLLRGCGNSSVPGEASGDAAAPRVGPGALPGAGVRGPAARAFARAGAGVEPAAGAASAGAGPTGSSGGGGAVGSEAGTPAAEARPRAPGGLRTAGTAGSRGTSSGGAPSSLGGVGTAFARPAAASAALHIPAGGSAWHRIDSRRSGTAYSDAHGELDSMHSASEGDAMQSVCDDDALHSICGDEPMYSISGEDSLHSALGGWESPQLGASVQERARLPPVLSPSARNISISGPIPPAQGGGEEPPSRIIEVRPPQFLPGQQQQQQQQQQLGSEVPRVQPAPYAAPSGGEDYSRIIEVRPPPMPVAQLPAEGTRLPGHTSDEAPPPPPPAFVLPPAPSAQDSPRVVVGRSSPPPPAHHASRVQPPPWQAPASADQGGAHARPAQHTSREQSAPMAAPIGGAEAAQSLPRGSGQDGPSSSALPPGRAHVEEPPSALAIQPSGSPRDAAPPDHLPRRSPPPSAPSRHADIDDDDELPQPPAVATTASPAATTAAGAGALASERGQSAGGGGVGPAAAAAAPSQGAEVMPARGRVLDLEYVQSLATLQRHYWSELHVPGADAPFMVRGGNYLVDRIKIPAARSAFRLGAVEVVWLPPPGTNVAGRRLEGVVEHVSRFLPSVRHGGAPFSIIIHLVIPGSPLLGIVVVFVSDRHPATLGTPPPNPAADPQGWTPFDFVLHKFVYGSNAERDHMIKLIPHIAYGSWVIKNSVGTKPVILGKQLKTTYHVTPTYIEVDIDISANKVANYVTGMVRGATQSLGIDIGFVFEGKVPWELPERLIGCFRLDKLSLKDAAKELDWSRELPLTEGTLPTQQPQQQQQQRAARAR